MAGWIDGDDMTAKRRNREWAPFRLRYPVYDINQAGSVTAAAKPADGDDVVTSETTHYTVPAVTLAVVHSLTVTNSDTGENQASVHLVPSGGSRQVANCIIAETLGAGESLTVEGPWYLDPSDTIRSISTAAAANEVGLRADVSEYTDLPAGVAPIVDDGDALTASHAAYYTCPGANVQHANVEAVTLCNTDTVERTAEVAIVPSGQTALGRYFVYADTLRPGETVVISGPFVLEPNDFVSARASSAAVVSLRLAPVQFATT